MQSPRLLQNPDPAPVRPPPPLPYLVGQQLDVGCPCALRTQGTLTQEVQHQGLQGWAGRQARTRCGAGMSLWVAGWQGVGGWVGAGGRSLAGRIGGRWLGGSAVGGWERVAAWAVAGCAVAGLAVAGQAVAGRTSHQAVRPPGGHAPLLYLANTAAAPTSATTCTT